MNYLALILAIGTAITFLGGLGQGNNAFQEMRKLVPPKGEKSFTLS